ncbi:hypothetical protein EDD37DRAFT_474536 [Exophiala viscosa]|uniref:Transcription factor domain-containing protein n=1 Tax=Exophiala viscosa TaxID=2486360 RepID=A0AAN6DYR0_9EURO|nr:hypothetical protein EDD36DRAFT_463854 [Exophiala viscosa]KAI1622449.1 hypothetical protein EDD37DRAFT_474536 [Exophiala viscosa]
MCASKENNENSFTFLNYNTPNHSASHRRAVKSHISSKYRTTIRQQAQPRYALPQRSPDGALSSPTKSEDDEASLILRRRPKKSLACSPVAPEELNTHFLPSPIQQSFSGLRVDPFGVLPGPQTPCVANALDYYVQVITPLHEPLLVALNGANPMKSWVFPLILQHKTAFHAAVALSQAYFEKAQAPTAQLSQEVGYHRRKAISLLRDQLTNLKGPPDDAALLTVLALSSLDVVYKADSMANRKGLALMVAMKGGLDSLGDRGRVKAYLIQFDYFWMLETGSKSLFPFSKRTQQRKYPHHPFSHDTLELIRTLPTGFAAIAYQGSLGLDVLDILSRVNRFAQAKTTELDSSLVKDQFAEDEQHPDIFDACSCLHASATEHSLEKHLCLAIILLCFDIHSQPGSSSKLTPYRGSRQELTRSLPLTPLLGSDERACLIWIWMIVIGSWKMSHDTNDQSFFLCCTFFERFEEVKQWDYVAGVMRQFLWYEPLYHGWRTSWREALDDYDRALRWRSSQVTDASLRDYGHFRPFESRSFKHYSRESTPASMSSKGTHESLSAVHYLPTRTRSIDRDADSISTLSAGGPNVVLPSMFTLDKYLDQIQDQKPDGT